MSLTDIQKTLCRALLDLSYESGFRGYPIRMLAERTGVPEKEIFDAETETGHLWELGLHGSGSYAGFLSLDHSPSGSYVIIMSDTRETLEKYVRY